MFRTSNGGCRDASAEWPWNQHTRRRPNEDLLAGRFRGRTTRGRLLGKTTTSSAPAEQVVIPPTDTKPSGVVLPTVQSFTVTSETVQAGQTATADVTVQHGGPVDVTVAWFGSDGWLIGETQRTAEGTKLTFVSPPLKEAGPHHVELRHTQTAAPLGSATVAVGS